MRRAANERPFSVSCPASKFRGLAGPRLVVQGANGATTQYRRRSLAVLARLVGARRVCLIGHRHRRPRPPPTASVSGRRSSGQRRDWWRPYRRVALRWRGRRPEPSRPQCWLGRTESDRAPPTAPARRLRRYLAGCPTRSARRPVTTRPTPWRCARHDRAAPHGRARQCRCRPRGSRSRRTHRPPTRR
jgi:hypothetical protein